MRHLSGTNRDLRVWLLVLCYFTVAAIAFAAAGFRLRLADGIAMAGLTLVGGGLSIAAVGIMPRSSLVRIVSALHQQAVLGLASAMLAYGAATLRRPLVDAALLSFDRALGYDWHAYVGGVAAMPWLAHLLSAAYESLFWQMLVITLVAGCDRERAPLQEFVTAHVVVLIISIGLFALWPVTTAWVHLGLGERDLRALHLISGGWPRQLLDLRAGLVTDVTPQCNFAIIGFPSYHCAAGLINIWAMWRYRWLRWPSIVVVATMIAATPINGGHYIADLLGAVAVTAIGIALARAFIAPATFRFGSPSLGALRPLRVPTAALALVRLPLGHER